MFNNLFGKLRNIVGAKKTPPAPEIKKPVSEPRKNFVDQKRKAEEARFVSLIEELRKKEKEIDNRWLSLEEKEKFLRQKELRLDEMEGLSEKKKEEIEEIKARQVTKLEEVAALSREEAKKILINVVEKRLATWKAKKIKEIEEEIKAQEEELAKEILVEAIRHGTTDWVAEYTVSTIQVPNEDVKGKIIGREGRNIRALERATGVELELEEGNEIRLSSFDPIRREIAKLALQKLIRDGRIQPVRIEEVVRQTKEQLDRILIDEGKRICQVVGVFHLPLDLIKTVGKYKYRFSYGQNLATHTIEETKIGIAIAQELKADIKTVRLACLLHDIGKVLGEEGSHVELGVDYLKKFHLPEKVIDCVAEHHEDRPFSSVESVITWIADAASGSRPGARYEAHEEYIKRMSNIEETAKSFRGVADVAAYQAGREVRVIVKPEEVSDEELKVLTNEIAQKLDEEAKWAGQIKVVGIRESRVTAVSKENSR